MATGDQGLKNHSTRDMFGSIGEFGHPSKYLFTFIPVLKISLTSTHL